MKLLLCVFFLCLSSFPAAEAQTPEKMHNTILSPFGIGGDAHTSRDLTKWIPQMAAIGIHVMRCCDPSQMRYLTGYHIRFGGLLYGLPPGDTLDDPSTLPVKDIPAWSAYVTNSVKQANGQVKDWEVWNEPPNGIGPSQTAADYAKIMVSAYNAAHAVDPYCRVGLAAKSVHVNWLEQVIKAGAKDHFDYIVLHPYEVLGGVADHLGTEPVYMNIVRTVRKMLAAQDPAKVHVPIIFTEIGCDASKGADIQGETLVKAYTMGIAQGVACIEWFEGIDGDSGPMGLLEADGTPRPAYTAMAQIIKHLGQHPIYLGWVLFHQKDYGFVFRGAAGNVLVTWVPQGSSDHIDFGQAMQIVDPLTGRVSRANTCELSAAPRLVLGPPANLLQQARVNQSKPFPWGGDYTKAKSVSVTMGAKNVEKGLHTLSGDAIATDVVAYGGSARAGSVPGGNAFVVDPNFLFYKTMPIEITAVVRRNIDNDPAGFKLVYESTDGYKTAGNWYTIPDNKQWYTVRWKIDDPEFVAMWNYNFSLVSDGNQYNKYYIRSVTVTKL